MNNSINEQSTVEILDFNPNYASHFASLNYEWLERYFSVEDHDREMLDEPQSYIIDAGGHIFFAQLDEEIVGTAALILESDSTYELAKMAVKPGLRGLGIGKKLIERSFLQARKDRKEKVVLESSRKLENALELYRKMGFEEVPQTGCSPYTRCDIRMSIDL